MFSLFSRTLLTVMIVVSTLFIFLWQWFQFNQEFSRNQTLQSLHKDLATNLVENNPLLSKGKRSQAALQAANHDLKTLGPNFEIYILNNQGDVVTYNPKEAKIITSRISTQTLEQFIRGDAAPLQAEDPRSPENKKVFSAARLYQPNGKQTGYLYITMAGKDIDAGSQSINWQHLSQFWNLVVIITSLLSLLLLVLLIKYLTKPLSQLEKELSLSTKKNNGEQTFLPRPEIGSPELKRLSGHINKLIDNIVQQQQALGLQQKKRHALLQQLACDLQTPLTSLQGYIETWLKQPASERSEDLIAIAADSGRHLQQRLAQLLELAALENGQVTPKAQTVLLTDVLNDLYLAFSAKASAQKVQLKFGVKPIKIKTDPQLLQRLLNNLLENLLRYTPHGGEICITAQRDTCIDKPKVWLNMKNNDSKMRQHELSALKKLTEQTANLNNDKSSQPQLSVELAIVSQLLALLNHQVEIESNAKASSISIELPSCPFKKPNIDNNEHARPDQAHKTEAPTENLHPSMSGLFTSTKSSD